MKNKMYKGFTGEIKEVNDTDRSLVALVSTDTRDRMDEVLEPSGADLENYRKNPVVLFAHDMRTIPPIGRAVWIKEAAEGIIAKVQFAKTQLAEDLFQLYKNKFMRAFSVGFIPKEIKEGDGLKEPRKTITKWELLEFSAVPVPANPDALVLALKSAKSVVLKKELQAEKWGQDIADIIEKANAEEKAEYNCECIKCGHKIKSKEHCKDLKCPKCGGQMRRAERPGPGQAGIDDIKALTDELDTLKTQHEDSISGYKKEIADLKYTLYLLLAKLEHQPDTVSEMTDDAIKKTIEDCVFGVVRQVTGKVS